ncbi:MAG: MopE-related protein [Minicystis sp.]
MHGDDEGKNDARSSRRRPIARAALGLGAAAGLAFAASGGCSQAAPGDGVDQGAGAGDQAIAQAQQGLTSAQVCLDIRRQGASGTVFDTQIANKLPPKNYGTSQTMNTGPVSGAETQILLQYDLSAIPSGPNTNIVTATINLARAAQAPSGPGTIEVHNILAPWSESTVTWQSFNGAFDPTILNTFSNQATFPSFTIQPLVQQWVRGTLPNYGVLLRDPGANYTNLWTSEYTNFYSRPDLYVCYTVTCSPGFADCNGNGLDGCETNLGTSAANCGACGNACNVPNAAAACANGTCQVGACNLGFADCNNAPGDGCETLLTTNQNCGGCGVACALPNGSASCTSGTCTLTACNPGHYDCDGNPQNGCEATPCANGSHCATGAGCQSGVCANGICATPLCNDGVQNGAETAVDCGGTCAPCAAGQACNVASDCQSGVCSGGTCAAPSCADSVKNGTETAADCGGSCPACATGLSCSVGADCQSGVCTGGVCQAPSCNDSLKNGTETAIDCGGGSCPACPAGKTCNTGSDCVDKVCQGGVCQLANCTDGVQNGAEADVDCGGPCVPCNAQAHCTVDSDCTSGVCKNGICQTPSCSDGVKNGNETGVDCGGSCFVPESCNGLDDDCNGLVDDGLGTTTCGVGACQVTVQNCVGGVTQTCAPLAPQPEQCDGLIDDDCDGVVDNGCNCVDGKTQSCYTAAPGTLGVGICQAGVQTCAHGQWGACVGEITPSAEACDGLDNDCNGQVDDGLGQTVCGIGACQVTTPNCLNGLPQTCTPRPPGIEACDAVDNDCDGLVDNNLPEIVCGVGACQNTVPSCVNGQAQACAPLSASAEACDGLDNDCDGQIDNGNPGGGQPCNTGLKGACATGVTACQGGGIVCVQTVFPKAEACDGLDNDCDGVIDNGNPGGNQACNTGKQGVCAAGTTVCSGGQLSCQQSVQPHAESCNGLDDDCDGVVDNGNPGGGLSCGTGKQGVCAAGTTACAAGSIVCNQNVQPSAEICDGMLDQNCNGQVDEGCACTNGSTQSCYTGAAGTQGVGACKAGTQTCVNGQWGACVGQVLPTAETCDGVDNNCNGQVDDGLGTISCGVGQCGRTVAACVNGHAGTCTPGAPQAETCDGLDNDCDGVVDNGNPGGNQACSTGKLGICAAGTTACVSGALVCNQTKQATAETCNGLDDNCNGSVDEGVLSTFYRDADGDGYGNAGISTQACSAPGGYVGNASDCNDSNAGIRPGAAEICDGVDNNCNGSIDEGVKSTFYRDADGDGYGNAGISTQACSAPGGYVSNASDCNDGNANVRPGAAEVCDGVDNNCNGSVDEGNPGGGAACSTGQAGVCAAGTVVCSGGALVCSRNQGPSGEVCNGVDDNCDGVADNNAGCRVGVHRSYNPSNGQHMYTTNGSEASCCGYYVETANYYYLDTFQAPGTTPWYRCASGIHHFYATDPNCELWGPGARLYSMGYIATSQLSGTTPLYRAWSSSSGDHFYTTSYGEYLNAISANGFTGEGVPGYVWTSP